MISIKSDRKNMRSFISIDNAIPKIRKGIRAELSIIGRENAKYARALIKKPPKTGKFYKIDGFLARAHKYGITKYTRYDGTIHRASAIGEPPADRTGELRKSISYRTYGWERMEFGDKVFYGKFLEEGTKYTHPREHLKRTVRVKERDNFKGLQEVVKRIIK